MKCLCASGKHAKQARRPKDEGQLRDGVGAQEDKSEKSKGCCIVSRIVDRGNRVEIALS